MKDILSYSQRLPKKGLPVTYRESDIKNNRANNSSDVASDTASTENFATNENVVENDEDNNSSNFHQRDWLAWTKRPIPAARISRQERSKRINKTRDDSQRLTPENDAWRARAELSPDNDPGIPMLTSEIGEPEDQGDRRALEPDRNTKALLKSPPRWNEIKKESESAVMRLKNERKLWNHANSVDGESENQHHRARLAAVPSAIDSNQLPQPRMNLLDQDEEDHGKHQKRPISSMRRFLDSNEKFHWPRNWIGHKSTYCDFEESAVLPLYWQRRLGDKTDVFSGGARLEFKKPFVVKIIRDEENSDRQKEAGSRIGFLKKLRHPHCIACLGFYTQSDHLYVLTFPVAQCNLKNLIDDVSRIHAEEQQKTAIQNPPNSVISKARSPACFFSYEDGVKQLLRCFVCLCQAVSYIHGEGILHRDINPKNILLDESGSVLMTHIGEPKSHRAFYAPFKHSRRGQWNTTSTIQGEASDVFSLGLVLLEAATLILRHDHEELNKLLRFRTDATGGYELYPGTIHRRIDRLKQPKSIFSEDKTDSEAVRDVRILEVLPTIREILNEEPWEIPQAHGLWEKFKWVSLELCADCDPRHPGVWRPQGLNNSDMANANSFFRPDNVLDQEFPDASSMRTLSLSRTSLKEQSDSSSLTSLTEKDARSSQSIVPESKPVRTDVVAPTVKENAIADNDRSATSENFSENNDDNDVPNVAPADSLFSVPGLTTVSNLSVNSSKEILRAAEKLAVLLLEDDGLEPLYDKALEQMEINEFQKNLTKLLGTFAVDLLKEAGNGMQRSAAQLVRECAKYVTSCICKHYTLGKDEASEHMNALKMQASQREEVLEGYSEQQIIFNTFAIDSSAASETKDVGQSGKEPDFDESQPALEDRSQLRNLDGVKSFILDSSAMSNLRENLQSFVFGEPDRGQVREPIAYPPFEASIADNSDEIARLEDSDLDESMVSDEATVIQLNPPPKQAAPAADSLLRSILPIIKFFAEFLELREKPLRPGYRRIRWTCVRRLLSFD